MEFTLASIVLTGAVLFISCLIQSTVGFAAGLFGIPLLVLLGLTVPQAIAFNITATLIQTTWGAYKLRNDFDVRETTLPIILRLISIPAGIWCLWWIGSLHQTQVKQFIGVVLLAILAVQHFARIQPREHVPKAWTWFAFLTSGFMAGIVGMGGPAMVLWVVAHRWSTAKARGFLFFVFAVCTVPQVLMMVYGWGREVVTALLLGLAALPMAILGTLLGLWIGNRLPTQRLRQLTMAMLLLIALSAILTPLLPG